MPTSFGKQGATPYNPFPSSGIIPFAGGSTPASTALNNAAAPKTVPSPAPAPTNQPIKKQTINNIDGSSHVTEYHAPETAGTPAKSPTQPKQGLIPQQQQQAQSIQQTIPGPITGNATTPSGATVNATSGQLMQQPQQQTQANNTFPGLIGQLGDLGKQPSATQNTALNAAQEAKRQYDLDTKQLLDTKTAHAGEEARIGMLPIGVGSQTGQKQIANTQYAQVEDALAQKIAADAALFSPAIGAATTGQGQQIGAVQQAAGLMTPGNQFIQQNPATTLIGPDGQPVQQGGAEGNFSNPFTGEPLQGSGNPKLDNAVQNALQMIKNGAGYTNSLGASGLSVFGPNGINSLNNALPKGFNVNASDASANAQATNIGTVGTTQKTAAATGYTQAIQQRADADAKYTGLTGISGQLTDTLGKWGNTGTLTNYNQALNTIGGLTSNPDYQAFVVALGNTQAAYQSILGSAGVTPTKADTDAMNALSPNSSATAIVSALNQLSKDAHSLVVVPTYGKVSEFEKQLGY